MEERIARYLTEECGNSSSFVQLCLGKMRANPDIMAAFDQWLDKRDFDEIDSPVVAGYTAASLHRTGRLSPVGVFNFLIYLRNKPEEALNALKRGLPRK